MTPDELRKLPGMPAAGPSFPFGPFVFIDRQYFVVQYRTDKAAIREALPEPLMPDGDVVSVAWIAIPDGSGFGAYTAASQSIPCSFKGRSASFNSQMFMDCEPPVAASREIWGYPTKHAQPKLAVESDTLTGRLDYAGQRVANGTMTYKHALQPGGITAIAKELARDQVNLKLIPDVDGKPAIAQLVGYNFEDIKVKGAWVGEARLELIPHVNAPLADLPIKEVVGCRHFICDLTLPYGKVIHNYLKKG